MDKSFNKVIAVILIAIGISNILKHTFDIDLLGSIQLWPLFILIPGLCFEYSYFSTGKKPGILVPGGILTTLGLLFLLEANTGFIFKHYTGFIYILAPSIGLFQLYLFGGKNKGLLIPVGVLTVVAAIEFIDVFFGDLFSFIDGPFIWSIILIVVGLVFLFDKKDTLRQEYDKKTLK